MSGTAAIVHFVGSIPLPDAETVFRTVSAATGPHLKRLPDGETGIRKTWIRFLQDVLAENPAIEVARDVPPFKFVQWDGKLIREIRRLRVKPGATPDPASFKTGYAEMAPGPNDFRSETIAVLTEIGDAVPAAIELGYHLCYGSPADEHLVQPKDAGIMVEIINRVTAGVRRPIQFFHLPVSRPRSDDAYFVPLEGLKLRPETELYLGLIHRDDAEGNATRLAAARRHVRVDGVATECGMARGDPARFPALLAAHAETAELPG